MVRKNRSTAQSIIETVVGIIFLIPIVLFLFDIGVMVLANTANDNLAKQAARAAASAAPTGVDPTPGNIPQFRTAAQQAAQKIVNNFAQGRTSGYITGVELSKMWYDSVSVGGGTAPPAQYDQDPGKGNVMVFTKVEAVAPVPFPGFDTHRTFFSKAVEPIVSLPPDVTNP